MKLISTVRPMTVSICSNNVEVANYSWPYIDDQDLLDIVTRCQTAWNAER
jgi:hypothetical protein